MILFSDPFQIALTNSIEEYANNFEAEPFLKYFCRMLQIHISQRVKQSNDGYRQKPW